MRHKLLIGHVARHQSHRIYHLNRGIGQMVAGFALILFALGVILTLLLYG